MTAVCLSLGPETQPTKSEAGGDEGIAIQSLEPGTTLIVQTRNSQYRVLVLNGTGLDAIVTGGQLFQDPTRVQLDGATAGSSLLKIGWIGVGLSPTGLRRP